jgi:hypothetical protein
MKLIENNPTLTVTSNATVVSHDNQPALPVLKSDMTYSEATEHINALYKMRIQWESDQYRTSCIQLYELLRECYRVAAHVDIDDLDSALRRCIEDQCKRKMIKILKSTTIEAKIVRSVFESLNNRQRVSAYAIVIQAAKLENVTVDHFVDWLELKGGVEEVRLSQTTTPNKTKTRFKAVKRREPTAEEMRVGQASFDAFLKRFSDTNENSANDDDIETSDCSPESEVLAARLGTSECNNNQEPVPPLDEPSSSAPSAISDKINIANSVDKSSIAGEISNIASVNRTRSSDDDELVVCIARRNRTNDNAEIVYAVTDDALSRLVFAKYAEARYGISDQLSELTRNIVSEIAA